MRRVHTLGIDDTVSQCFTKLGLLVLIKCFSRITGNAHCKVCLHGLKGLLIMNNTNQQGCFFLSVYVAKRKGRTKYMFTHRWRVEHTWGRSWSNWCWGRTRSDWGYFPLLIPCSIITGVELQLLILAVFSNTKVSQATLSAQILHSAKTYSEYITIRSGGKKNTVTVS